MWKSLLAFLAAIASYYSNKQLLDAGRAEEKADVFEAERKATKEVQQIISDIDALPDNVIDKRLSKWKRD